MDRIKALKDKATTDLFKNFIKLHNDLDDAFISQYDRSLPLNEVFVDRWERAKKLGFGENTSIYDSSVVIGRVKVGANCWMGPYTIIDGSGNITIGDYCTISAGVQIYTHDNIKQTLSSGKHEIERMPINIGHNSYIGPNVIVTKGVNIGNFCVIGANAFINKNIPNNSIVIGQPGKIVGKVVIEDEIKFEYF